MLYYFIFVCEADLQVLMLLVCGHVENKGLMTS